MRRMPPIFGTRGGRLLDSTAANFSPLAEIDAILNAST